MVFKGKSDRQLWSCSRWLVVVVAFSQAVICGCDSPSPENDILIASQPNVRTEVEVYP